MRKTPHMSADLQAMPIESVDDLTDLFAAPGGPTLLFLHDPYCPISGGAWRQVKQFGRPVHTVDVSRQRDLNAEIARRTGVRHESPQAFVLVDGEAVWNASHRSITDRALQEAWLTAEAESTAGTSA